MNNSKEIFRDLQQQITLNENRDEIYSILYLVLNAVTGLSRADILAEKEVSLNKEIQRELEDMVLRINNQEPVQYILGEAYFYGRRFKVSPAVLIPRPETELLIEEVLKETSADIEGSILDIGTGSGCIAITLSKELPKKTLKAIDISEAALKIAEENAKDLQGHVEFLKMNILTDSLPFNDFELIVSNPPYVSVSEKESMKSNVLNFEPHLALFVPDEDPLIFYKTIAQKSYLLLSEHGKVVVEINERFGNEVAGIFKTNGFRHVRIVKDFQQKDRIVIAAK